MWLYGLGCAQRQFLMALRALDVALRALDVLYGWLITTAGGTAGLGCAQWQYRFEKQIDGKLYKPQLHKSQLHKTYKQLQIKRQGTAWHTRPGVAPPCRVDVQRPVKRSHADTLDDQNDSKDRQTKQNTNTHNAHNNATHTRHTCHTRHTHT